MTFSPSAEGRTWYGWSPLRCPPSASKRRYVSKPPCFTEPGTNSTAKTSGRARSTEEDNADDEEDGIDERELIPRHPAAGKTVGCFQDGVDGEKADGFGGTSAKSTSSEAVVLSDGKRGGRLLRRLVDVIKTVSSESDRACHRHSVFVLTHFAK